MVIYLILILFERYVRLLGGALAISQILNNALVQQTSDDDLTQGNLGTRANIDCNNQLWDFIDNYN